ncbi:DUF6571 family protein, partial [Actinomyces slackii]
MAKFKLNPDRLKSEIERLTLFIQETRSARSAIHRKYESTAGKYNLSDISSFNGSVSANCDRLAQLADEIESARRGIVHLNQNGLTTSPDGSGTVEYEIPDGTVIKSGKALKSWSQGKVDGHNLKLLTKDYNNLNDEEKKQYKKIIEEGDYLTDIPDFRREEKLEEIRKRLESRSDDNYYSAGVVDGVGPENLTSIPLREREIDTQKKMAKFLGIHLAGASKTWTRDKQKSVARAIKESMDESGEYGRITVFNRMMKENNTNKNGRNSLSFNKDFLVTLGNTLRSIDWQKISRLLKNRKELADEGNDTFAVDQFGDFLTDGSWSWSDDDPDFTIFDPIYGILDAMTGNPHAAAEFFAPNGRTSAPQDIRDIIHRSSLGDNDWTKNLTTISAHMAEEFGREDFSKAGKTTKSYMDKSAFTTSLIFNEIGENDVKLGDLARENAFTVMTIYAPGVENSGCYSWGFVRVVSWCIGRLGRELGYHTRFSWGGGRCITSLP